MYWSEWALTQNSEQWMKTEDCYGSQHHHENVKWLDWSYEDHEISMKSMRIFNMLSSFVSIRSRSHSNDWKRQFHWWSWDYHRMLTVAKSRKKEKCWRVLLFGSFRSFGRDDGWFNCGRLRFNEILCELFGNNGIDFVKEWFSDDGFVTQWCERGVFGGT